MSATAPFAMLISEGWRRESVADALARIRSGEYQARADDGQGERMLVGTSRSSISIDRACHEPGNDGFDPERTRGFALSTLEALLARSETEHLDRIVLADQALDLAARLSRPAEIEIPSREISATARGMYGSPSFSAIEKTRDRWITRMRADPRRRSMPTCVCVDVSSSRITIWCRNRTIHGVVVLDPLERLRTEVRLGTVLAAIAGTGAR